MHLNLARRLPTRTTAPACRITTTPRKFLTVPVVDCWNAGADGSARTQLIRDERAVPSAVNALMLAPSWHWYSSMVPEYLDNPAGRLLRVLRQLVAARDIRDEHRQNVFAKRRDAGVAPDAGFEEHELDAPGEPTLGEIFSIAADDSEPFQVALRLLGVRRLAADTRNSVRSLSDDEDPEFLYGTTMRSRFAQSGLPSKRPTAERLFSRRARRPISTPRRCRVTRLSMAWRRVPVRFTAGNESRSSTRVSSTS